MGHRPRSDTVCAYMGKGIYLNRSGRSNEGLRAADEGLAINPSSATLYNTRSYAEINLGRFDQAKSDILQAMRLSPRDPTIPLWRTNLADAEMGLGHFDAAIDLIHQSIDAGYRVSYTYRELAAAYALEGKMDDAKTALAEALRLSPKLTVKSGRAHKLRAGPAGRPAQGGAAGGVIASLAGKLRTIPAVSTRDRRVSATTIQRRFASNACDRYGSVVGSDFAPNLCSLEPTDQAVSAIGANS